MEAFICVTCGTQFPPSPEPPQCCPICEDERQYVGYDGQQWTDAGSLRASHSNQFIDFEPGVTAIMTEPRFAIGQRAFLIESGGGNVLWDCITLLDDATVEVIRQRGGLKVIAISHPHYYSAMVEWMDAFDVPVMIHAADKQWVMRPDPRLQYWEGESLELHDGMTLIRGGGHFPGGAMLHVPQVGNGAGALFSGDIIQVVPDRRWVSFMYSYPNLIPLSATEVRRIGRTVEPFTFERIYGAFHPMQVERDGSAAVRRSVDRYVRHVSEISV
jgi:hypothetical protein